MAYQTFEEAIKNMPTKVYVWVFAYVHEFAEKYFSLLDLDYESQKPLYDKLVDFLVRLGAKFYEVSNLYTLSYLLDSILSEYKLDNQKKNELAKLIYEDYLAELDKVWQGIAEKKSEKEQEIKEKLTEAIIEQINIQQQPTPSPEEKEAKTEKIVETEKTQEEEKEGTKQEESIFVPPEEVKQEEIPTISWQEEQKVIEKEPEIIYKEVKSEEKKQESGPIDVSSL